MPLSHFVVESRLGQGSYAGVFKVNRKATNKTYALKKVDLNGLNPKELANALNEILLLTSFNHPRIVGVYEIFIEEPGDLCIVMEYCGYQDLHQKIKRYIHRKEYIDERIIWVYMIQILEGLKALHDKGVLHRDLKPANCFLASDGSVKIGDFNVSKVVQEGINASTMIGTPFYMAPEIWQKKSYSYAADIWSLGCTIYELAALRPPILAANMLDLQAKVPRGQYDALPAVYSRGLAAVIDRMLRPDPTQRPSAAELLSLPAVQACYVLVKNRLPAGDIPLRTDDQAVMTFLDPETVASLPLSALAGRLPGPAYPEDNPLLAASASASTSNAGGSSSPDETPAAPSLQGLSLVSPSNSQRGQTSPSANPEKDSADANRSARGAGPVFAPILAPISLKRGELPCSPKASSSSSPAAAVPLSARRSSLARNDLEQPNGLKAGSPSAKGHQHSPSAKRLESLNTEASSDGGDKTILAGQGGTPTGQGAGGALQRGRTGGISVRALGPSDKPSLNKPTQPTGAGDNSPSSSSSSSSSMQRQGSVRKVLSAAKEVVG